MNKLGYAFIVILALVLIGVGITYRSPDSSTPQVAQEVADVQSIDAVAVDAPEDDDDSAVAPTEKPGATLDYLNLVTPRETRDFATMREKREIRALVSK